MKNWRKGHAPFSSTEITKICVIVILAIILSPIWLPVVVVVEMVKLFEE